MASPLKVCIVGCGNWGSAIARIIGNNAKSLQHFATTVTMWVFEEHISGRKLSDIINTEHENIKYLPGYKLPENVVAVPKLCDAAEGADLLVFVVPHQFIRKLCDEMVGCVSTKARGITLIKVSSYHGTTLEFTELLRATHSLSNVCRSSLQAEGQIGPSGTLDFLRSLKTTLETPCAPQETMEPE